MAEAEQTRVLRSEIQAVIDKLPAALRLFGLGSALAHLQAWAGQVDQRLELLELRSLDNERRIAALERGQCER